MITTCPSCHKRLKVPDGAVGRRARCPACKGKFVVADPEATSFETIAGFILDEEAATKAIQGLQVPMPVAPKKN